MGVSNKKGKIVGMMDMAAICMAAMFEN